MLVRQVGWTHTQTAWAFSIAIFSLGFSAAWAGSMLPRLGPRRLALAGSIMFSGGYLIAGTALQFDLIPLFYLGYGVIGGAGIGFGYVTPVATVAKWFPDHKGLATGIVVMGFGIGAFLLSKGLAPFLIVRTAGALPLIFFWLGIIFACILIPCSLLLSDPPHLLLRPGNQAAPRDADEPQSVRTLLGTTQFNIMWDGVLLQHRRRDIGDQLPVGAPAGGLGTRRSLDRADHACRIRSDAHRRQLALQRSGAPLLGTPLGPAWAGLRSSASCWPARWWSSGF